MCTIGQAHTWQLPDVSDSTYPFDGVYILQDYVLAPYITIDESSMSLSFDGDQVENVENFTRKLYKIEIILYDSH